MQNRQARAAGMLFIRVLLGVIFFMQGFGKIFTIGVGKLYSMFFVGFEHTFLPRWLIWATAYYTTYVEFIGGFLLITGLFKKWALYLLAADLLVVSFGHGLEQPIWDLQHVIPRAVLLSALLLLPQEWDLYKTDYFLQHQK
jgi:putative oxidoreductase